MSTFRPMLACDVDLEKLRYPTLASAKLDGVRATVRGGVVYSRSNKPIPNNFVQKMLGCFEHLDGELIVGDPRSKTVYRDTVSHVMSHDKEGFDLRFHVFDHVKHPLERYQNRLVEVNKRPMSGHIVVVTHPQHVVTCQTTLLQLEEKLLNEGYEGLILRCPDAPYKYGRSTAKEGYLTKLKRMVTSEAVIIGFEERMHNGNVAETNELGRTKRSSHIAGKTGRGDLGALVGRDTVTNVEFSVGTGFSDDERAEIWNNQPKYLGRMFSYDHFPIGVKDKPRHPSYKGLRDSRDL
jgi:DNA ligase-1